MTKKFINQDFVNSLVNEHKVSKEVAEAFVKEFFSLIEEVLEKDRYLKIKGLGTFKLISVESRESIHVNTGERFEIQGHTKVTFTPDNSLRDVVNKPFSHFETVVLNENVVFDDEAPAKEEAPAAKVDELIREELKAAKPEKKKTKSSSKSYLVILFLLIAVMIGCFFSYRSEIKEFFSGENDATTLIAEKNGVNETEEPETIPVDTIVTDTIQGEKAEPQKEETKTVEVQQAATVASSPEPIVRRSSRVPVIPDSTSYNIVGTKTKYTLQEGETLVRVALKFYGTKDLWPYILMHNRERIKNPDVVPYGTTLDIPELEKK